MGVHVISGMLTTGNGIRPIHPGEILREEYLAPLDMSVNALAKALRVDATRMNEIARDVRARRGELIALVSEHLRTCLKLYLKTKRFRDLCHCSKSWITFFRKSFV